MFAWYKNAAGNEKRVFWACYSGWALDIYDTQTFSFLIPSLTLAWGLTKAQGGLVGTAALVSAAVGGWLAGIVADRIGRVRVLIFTVLWFTTWGTLAGFVQSFDQLLIARVLQGVGFGGEWAVGAALMAEVIDPNHRGKALGFVQSGYSLGWMSSALVSTLILTHLPPAMAWRAVFWAGLIPAAFVVILRLRIRDSAAFARTAGAGLGNTSSLSTVFQRQYVGTCLVSSLMVAGLQGGAYAVAIWIPTLLKERGVPAEGAMVNVLVMAVGTLFGFITAASLSDRWGRKPTLIVMSLGSWIVTVSYMFAPLNVVFVEVFGFFMGFFTIGVFASLGSYLSELFPTNVRTTCMGFSYNLGKTVGALAITGVGVASASMGLGAAIGAFCFLAYAVAVSALMALPETRGTDINAVIPVTVGLTVEGDLIELAD